MPLLNTTRGALHWIDTCHDRAGPPVLLIHGLGGDAGFWSAEQAALAARHRVLAVDLRGSGLTPGTHSPFSADALAQDLLAMLDHAGIDRVHVVGFSMGGVVAQALVSAAPTRVHSLVLAATFATPNTQSRLFLQAVGAVYRAGATPKQIFDLVLPWLFSVGFLSDPRAAPWLDYPDDAPDEQTAEDWQRLLDAMIGFDGRPRLPHIHVPTLVIGGDEDRLATPEDAQVLLDGIPSARLSMLRGGHLMNVESPDAFLSELERFFLAHAPAGG